MAHLTLILQANGARPQQPVTVDSAEFVGTCVAALVEHFRFPRQDARGDEVIYRLRHVHDQQPLPQMARFQETAIRSGAHVLLEAQRANDATVALASNAPSTRPGARATGPLPSGSRIWKRRTVLGALITCSGAGLALGLGTAAAQRVVRAAAVPAPPPVSPLSRPRGITLHTSFSAHTNIVRTARWSPDGTRLASAGDDAQLVIWQPDGTILQQMTQPAPVLALAWSPESQRLMTGAGPHVTFVHAASGTILARSSQQHTAAVRSVDWTPYNQRQAVSAGVDTRAFVWETQTYRPLTRFARHDTPIDVVSWEADGRTIASASQGGAVRVWDAATGIQTHGVTQDAQVAMRAGAFAPQGTALAIAGDDGIVRIWHNGGLCLLQHAGQTEPMCLDVPLRLAPLNSPIHALAWSPNAQLLLGGCVDGSVALWSPFTSTTPLFTHRITPGQEVHSVAWSPHADRLLTAAGTTVLLWTLS